MLIGISGSPAHLDGAQIRDPEAGRIVFQLFEPLLSLDRDGITLRPGLARSWQNSPDGQSWTFRLQSDVRFHDGTPFNAQAVCANFDRWYNFRGPQQSFAVSLSWQDVFGGFATRDDPSAPPTMLYRLCEARTEDEVVINLTRRSGRFLPAMAAWPFSIASPDALRRFEADKVTGTPTGPRFEGTFVTDHPIGTGPFKLDSFVPNERIVLVRDDDYWGARPKVNRVIYRPIADGAARRQALQSGEVHVIEPVEPGSVEPLQRSGFQIIQREPQNVSFIALNQRYPPLDNLKVRQAISHALNRETVVRAKYPAGTLLAKEFLFFREKAPPWGFDDPALFHAVNEANVEPDPARRIARYQDINRRVMEIAPGVPLALKSALAVSKRVQGFTVSPSIFERLENVTIR